MRSHLLIWLVLSTPLVAVAAKAPPATTTPPPQRPSHLGELNGLTKVLAPRGLIETKELERLLENAEAVALRDATTRPSAQAITYAAALEKQIDALKGDRPLRVLVDLALGLATLANPTDDFRQKSYADAFLKRLLAELKVPESEARARPEIVEELQQIGSWAQGLVEHYAPRLPQRAARFSLGRLYVTSGRYAQAIEYLKPIAASDARLRALLGAARLFDGKLREAEPDLQLALGHGGEAAEIARTALRESVRRRTNADLKRAFSDRDLGEDGGVAMCRQAQSGSPEQAAACAARLWMAGDEKAALQQAERAPNAPHLRLLGTLWKLQSERDPAAQAALRSKLAEQALPLPIGDRNRALVRIGASLQAALQTGGAPFSKDELALLDKLHKEAPCDPASLPLRMLALRGDRNALGGYASNIVSTCASRPDGLAATIEGLTALLELFHTAGADTGDLDATERVLMALADKHPDEPSLLGLKGDLLVLRGLRKEKAKPTAYRAALLIYEDALAKLSPLAAPALRARLESNAAYAATILYGDAPKPAKVDLERRAQKHLRLGLALGERPLLAAVRAKFGSLAKMLSSGTMPERWPAGPEKQRAVCLLAEQAKLAGDDKSGQRWQGMLSKDAAPPSLFIAPEIFVESGGAVQLLVEERGLAPIVEARSGLWFAPRCEGP